jgi:IS5 family transposase
MLAELPCYCSCSAKKSSDGHNQYWKGYKLHLDVADGQIPISAVLTAAHVHDSQVAIPLSTMTAQRVTSLYEVMDAAYDAEEIMEHVRSQGRVPIIAASARGRKSHSVIMRHYPRQLSPAEEQRYRERTMVERVNGRLKDEFGGRCVRVRGAVKVMAHLMFGVIALTADQLLRLGTESG